MTTNTPNAEGQPSRPESGTKIGLTAIITPVIGIVGLGAALGLFFAVPGSARSVAIGCGLGAVGALLSAGLLGRIRPSLAMALAVVAAVAAGLSGAAYQKSTQSVSAQTRALSPEIQIDDPLPGDWITQTPVISGTVKNFNPSTEEVRSFNEPFTTVPLSARTGQAYPDAGTCQVSDGSFTCNKVFAGEPQDACRKVVLWVAVVTISQSLADANIKDGTQTYLLIDDHAGPPHIGEAIDQVAVQRYPAPSQTC